ncbi:MULTISPECIES: hypothetical protein [Roseobacteraceae]|uniref:hypothetical protein n=1 Tax=Roseobacteraceae TaxID=2854170 RepID=UPI0013BD9DAA|nr:MULTISPECIES: hypothetical protein [Roseobacteraceae]MCA0994076.1 hypothetical protein [Alloyangia pacifica]NDV99832.1 hypothetical protein [Salipiger sp. PrR002]NDW56570.1 hypothetical protein [Salipiger sp. PrR004]
MTATAAKTDTAAREALDALEQAFAYYQPEPALVHASQKDVTADLGTLDYYQAA